MSQRLLKISDLSDDLGRQFGEGGVFGVQSQFQNIRSGFHDATTRITEAVLGDPHGKAVPGDRDAFSNGDDVLHGVMMGADRSSVTSNRVGGFVG